MLSAFDFTDVGNKVGAFVSKAAARAMATGIGVKSPDVSAAAASWKGPDGIGASVGTTGVSVAGVGASPSAAAKGLGGLFGSFVRGVAGGLGLDENTVKLGAVGLAALLLLRK